MSNVNYTHSTSSENPAPEVETEEPQARFIPIVTISFGIAIAVVFLLEMLWGGSTNKLTLIRMGANLGRENLPREPWRILSSAFLHIGPIHAALNLWCLWVFGSFLEMLIGPRRLIVLYTASAIGCGILSNLMHETMIGAGASGAVWGMMCAGGALAIRPYGLIRPEALSSFRQNAMLNIGINLLYSFSPGISLSGHLGGGLVGATLMFSGILLIGITPNAVSEQFFRAEKIFQHLARFSVVLIITAISIAWGIGKPWGTRVPLKIGEVGASAPGECRDVIATSCNNAVTPAATPDPPPHLL